MRSWRNARFSSGSRLAPPEAKGSKRNHLEIPDGTAGSIVRGIERTLGGSSLDARAAVLAAAALVGQQVAARATRDALFLSHHDVARLPFAMAAAAVLSLVAVAASSRAMTRWPPARVVPAALAASGVLLVLEWLLSMVSAPAAAVALYLHVAVFGATLVSGVLAVDGGAVRPALREAGAGAGRRRRQRGRGAGGRHRLVRGARRWAPRPCCPCWRC